MKRISESFFAATLLCLLSILMIALSSCAKEDDCKLCYWQKNQGPYGWYTVQTVQYCDDELKANEGKWKTIKDPSGDYQHCFCNCE